MHSDFLAIFVGLLGGSLVLLWWASHRHHRPTMGIAEATRLAFRNYFKKQEAKRGGHK